MVQTHHVGIAPRTARPATRPGAPQSYLLPDTLGHRGPHGKLHSLRN
jgi:hypothetical protein